MPIANCIVSKEISLANAGKTIDELSEILDVESSEITIDFTCSALQIGMKYPLMIYLYIPSLWTVADREKIQLAFSQILSRALGISENDVFLITTIVESGQVVTGGKVVKW